LGTIEERKGQPSGTVHKMKKIGITFMRWPGVHVKKCAGPFVIAMDKWKVVGVVNVMERRSILEHRSQTHRCLTDEQCDSFV